MHLQGNSEINTGSHPPGQMMADGRNGKAVACNGPTAAHRQKNDKKAIISPKSPPVSIIIRPYKSAVTKHVNRSGFENGWQPRF